MNRETVRYMVYFVVANKEGLSWHAIADRVCVWIDRWRIGYKDVPEREEVWEMVRRLVRYELIESRNDSLLGGSVYEVVWAGSNVERDFYLGKLPDTVLATPVDKWLSGEKW